VRDLFQVGGEDRARVAASARFGVYFLRADSALSGGCDRESEAVDHGVTFFDTAEAYGPFINEALVGEATGHQP
jgi:diketogulonate reductase-like aldo/keto reductase